MRDFLFFFFAVFGSETDSLSFAPSFFFFESRVLLKSDGGYPKKRRG